MKIIPILLILCGITIIYIPNILEYIMGGILIFFGLNWLLLGGIFQMFKNKKSGKKGHGDDYVQFGKYKIFK